MALQQPLGAFVKSLQSCFDLFCQPLLGPTQPANEQLSRHEDGEGLSERLVPPGLPTASRASSLDYSAEPHTITLYPAHSWGAPGSGSFSDSDGGAAHHVGTQGGHMGHVGAHGSSRPRHGWRGKHPPSASAAHPQQQQHNQGVVPGGAAQLPHSRSWGGDVGPPPGGAAGASGAPAGGVSRPASPPLWTGATSPRTRVGTSGSGAGAGRGGGAAGGHRTPATEVELKESVAAPGLGVGHIQDRPPLVRSWL